MLVNRFTDCAVGYGTRYNRLQRHFPEAVKLSMEVMIAYNYVAELFCFLLLIGAISGKGGDRSYTFPCVNFDIFNSK